MNSEWRYLGYQLTFSNNTALELFDVRYYLLYEHATKCKDSELCFKSSSSPKAQQAMKHFKNSPCTIPNDESSWGSN